MKRGKVVQWGSCRKHNELVVVLSRNVAFGAAACVLIVVSSTAPLTMIGPSLDFVGWCSLGMRSVDVGADFCDFRESRVCCGSVSFECLSQPNWDVVVSD